MLLIVKAKVAIKSVVLVAPVAFALGGAGVAPPPLVPVTTVSVAAGSFQYRVAGDFALEGRPVNAPRHDYRVVQSLTFMKTQVSAAEYDRCVADKACERRFGKEQGRADLPVVGVSWQDATSYAKWLSLKTGMKWRLPSDAEWAYAAGSRFKDDAVVADDGADGFSKRWIAKYDQESYRQASTDKTPKPFGTFGENERGLDRSCRQCLGMDRHVLHAPGIGPSGPTHGYPDRQLRGARGRGRTSELCDRLHPRCQGRRLCRRHPASQSRLPASAGRHQFVSSLARKPACSGARVRCLSERLPKRTRGASTGGSKQVRGGRSRHPMQAHRDQRSILL